MKSYIAGNYINQGSYKSFEPTFINRKWNIDNMELITLLGQADRYLGRLDMYSEHIPNIDLFISMHVVKEAIQSNKIEGTQTNIEDILLQKEDVPLEKRDDWEEVQNYIKAMNFAVQELQIVPFSGRLIKAAHQLLLQNVRGKHKHPGRFRESQNWIGGTNINDAIFIPPPHSKVIELMSDLEKFAHNTHFHIPELLKTGLIHYQFETIHPFLDGNGRVGRLIIPLYLVHKGILKRPILYLSDFFEKKRFMYYEKLMKVRTENDMTGWLLFFLNGIIETAKQGVTTFDNIWHLQKETDKKLQTLGIRVGNARQLINILYQNPMITANQLVESISISAPSAYTLLRKLEDLGILKEVTGGQRGRLYAFQEYIELF